jgi:hypothetical protein
MHALLTPYTDAELAARLAALVAAETARHGRTAAARGPAGRTGRAVRKAHENKGSRKKSRVVHFDC